MAIYIENTLDCLVSVLESSSVGYSFNEKLYSPSL